MKLPSHASLGAALLAALPAWGQSPTSPGNESQGTLRPVVVTPMPGVAQSSFDAPASVDVIDGAAIRNGQLQINLSESLVRVPGVVALNRQNYAQDLQISIRGYGSRATFGVRGLRLYADGIPATAPDGQGQVSHFDLGSADRIEVLRGPFSALYGNSSGGVISIFTADGGPETIGEVGTAFGSDGVRRVNARASGASGPWNFNFNAVRFETDGYRDHSAAQRTGFNGKAKYQYSPDTRFTFVLNSVDMPDVQDPLGLTRAEMQANPRGVTPVALDFDTRKSASQLQGGAIVEHRVNAQQSVKLTTWRGQRSTEQFQAIPVAVQTPPTHPGGVISLARDYHGADLQWVGKTRLFDSPLTVTAGLTADALEEQRRGYQNFVGARRGVMGTLRRNEDNRVRSFDQYLQGNWISERVSLTAGLRHSRVRFDSSDNYLANGNDSGGATYEATTPVLGAVFHVNDKLNVYAATGRGFETPTFNELAYRPDGRPGFNFALRPAESRQWELGVKAEPFTDWRVNAALFQARTEDEIVVLSNSGGRSTFQNAAGTRRRGLETAVQGSWGSGWSFLATATWLDAAYTSGFACLGGACATPNVGVRAGNRMPGIPRTSGFAELAWKHRPWGLETALEWRHTGRIATDDSNSDFAPRAGVFALRASLEQKFNRWTVREFVRVDNVADRQYVGSVIVNEGNRRFFEPAPGRTWLLGVNAAYAF